MPSLRLLADPELVSAAFLGWHATLVASAEQVGGAMQIDGTDVRFRRITRHKEKLHLDFWVGSSDAAAVQLNQPRVAGTENPGTTIAVDSRGRRYLVRQGDLHGNPSPERIKGEDFSRRTGLEPVTMRREDRLARKAWHIVAQLDGRSPARIRGDTAEVVRRCWNARTFSAQAAKDQTRLAALFGEPERGGWHDVDPATAPTRVLKVQGYVSECLVRILAVAGIELEKPRHAANYEVDGVVQAPGALVLIEIKTGVSAADVYGRRTADTLPDRAEGSREA